MWAVVEVLPFRALRPLEQLAARVAAPPYDVVDAAEARRIMRERPDSFLRVTRPDADLERPVDGAVDEHERARRALHELVRRGVLVREREPALWIYRQQVGGAVQTGIVGLAAVADYTGGAIRTHEHTRPDKEDERTRHIDALDAHDEPVFLFHCGSAELDAVLAQVTARGHDLAVTTPDGVWHTLWRLPDADSEARVVKAFAAIDRLYLADGHHRSAAAVRLHALRRDLPPAEAGETAGFLAVIFGAAGLTVLPYHRVVLDLGGLSPGELLQRLDTTFAAEPSPGPVQPGDRTTIGLRTPPGWHRLRLRSAAPTTPGEGLPATLLQDLLLGPVLGITDPRRNPRLDFVGGPDGLRVLDDAVASGRAEAAFSLCPTGLDDLVALSDRGEVMPPKSTWFHPKPASGLLVHPLH
jgi:uncharacterized protein (DUF1015 family)